LAVNLSRKKAGRFGSEKEPMIRKAGPNGKKATNTSGLKIPGAESSLTPQNRLKGEH
jgi:hypothetical protein